MLLKLFLFFLKIGFISFGGGYAVIPMIQFHMSSQAWLSDSEFQEIVTLASMAPGSVATNSATLIGYRIAGTAGAIASTIGIIMPSLIIIVLIAAFFYKFHNNKWVKAAFYGLRPIIVALIGYAALVLGAQTIGLASPSWMMIMTLVICAASLLALIKYKLHPFIVIIAAGVVGIILF